MTCATDNDTRTIIRGTTEYLKVELTADVTLDTQDVEFSLDGQVSWLPADPVGGPALVRVYRHLLLPAEQPDDLSVEVLVRITDSPEIVIIPAGFLTITD